MMTNRKCPSCGEKVPDDQPFLCPNCGEAIDIPDELLQGKENVGEKFKKHMNEVVEYAWDGQVYQAAPLDDLSPGALVILRSGGPLMTVVGWEQTPRGPLMVNVCWFQDDKKMNFAPLPIQSLYTPLN